MGRNSTYEELKHTYCEPFRVRVCVSVLVSVFVRLCLYAPACTCMHVLV